MKMVSWSLYNVKRLYLQDSEKYKLPLSHSFSQGLHKCYIFPLRQSLQHKIQIDFAMEFLPHKLLLILAIAVVSATDDQSNSTIVSVANITASFNVSQVVSVNETEATTKIATLSSPTVLLNGTNGTVSSETTVNLTAVPSASVNSSAEISVSPQSNTTIRSTNQTAVPLGVPSMITNQTADSLVITNGTTVFSVKMNQTIPSNETASSPMTTNQTAPLSVQTNQTADLSVIANVSAVPLDVTVNPAIIVTGNTSINQTLDVLSHSNLIGTHSNSTNGTSMDSVSIPKDVIPPQKVADAVKVPEETPVKAPVKAPVKPPAKESRPLRSPDWPLNRKRVDSDDMKSEKHFTEKTHAMESDGDLDASQEMKLTKMEEESMTNYGGRLTWMSLVHAMGGIALGAFVAWLLWRGYQWYCKEDLDVAEDDFERVALMSADKQD